MSIDAKIGHGIQLRRADTTTAGETNFTAVGEVRNVSQSESGDSIDVTDFDSTDAYREFIPGLQDGGEVTFELFAVFDDASSHVALRTDKQARNVRDWRLALNDVTTSLVTFRGFITSLENTMAVSDPNMTSVTIKVTGKPTWGT